MQKFFVWIKSLWNANKTTIVNDIVAELENTKPTVQALVVKQLQASGQDLTKMSVGDAVSLILNISYTEVETVIRRQI